MFEYCPSWHVFPYLTELRAKATARWMSMKTGGRLGGWFRIRVGGSVNKEVKMPCVSIKRWIADDSKRRMLEDVRCSRQSHKMFEVSAPIISGFMGEGQTIPCDVWLLGNDS
ncbi:hypothetical protein SK128_009109 [Halocaridina rubra]|uniref:Uncharacterized protein n=1 Tax=Halocaridina rubra TaxID=373956 RepID=A0AAN9A8Z7_HALRR